MRRILRPAARARSLDEQWELIAALERFPRRSAQLGLAAQADREARRARATVAPLRRWARISGASYQTYLSDTNRVRLSRVLDFVQDGDRVLDVGIGFGYVTGVLLRDRRLEHYVGIDLKEQFRGAVTDMIEANELADRPVRFEVLDLHDLTAEWMASHRPDVALVLEVLEHIPDPAGALSALSAALPPETTVLFTVPILGRLEGVWGHVSLFDRARIEEVCGAAGLTIHHVEPVHGTWTLVAASHGATPPARLRSPAVTARTPPALPRVSRGVLRRMPPPPPMSHSVTPVKIDGHQDFSRPVDPPDAVRLSHRRTGVFCEVQAPPGAAREGGARLPVTEPQLLRLELTCETPEALERIDVVGVDAGGAARLRWTWRHDHTAITAEPATHVLRCGRSSGRFRAEHGSDPSGVVAVDIVGRVRAGATAAFRVHRAAFVARR